MTGDRPIDRNLPCVKCGYDLFRLPSVHRCPECGYPTLRSIIDAEMKALRFTFPSAADVQRRPYEVLAETCHAPLGAIELVRDALVRAQRRSSAPGLSLSWYGPRHVSARHVCEALRDLAIDRFGPERCRAELDLLGLRRSEDVGDVMFLLVEGGILRAGEHDSPKDFCDLFTLDQWFPR